MKIDLSFAAVENTATYRKLLRELRNKTRFQEIDIENLLKMYQQFARASPNKKMSKQQFATLYVVCFDVPDIAWIDSIVTCVDPRSKDSISPEAFVRVMDIWMNGSLQEKIKFCFRVYDRQGTGFITAEKMRRYTRYMIVAPSQEETEDLVSDFVEFLLKRMDNDHDGRISFEDYSKTVQERPWLLEFMGRIIPEFSLLRQLIMY